MVTKQPPPLALVAVVVFLFSFPVATRAQDKRDIVSVRTRVVLVDTLVQDKKTGAPVADLTRENFEVLADGKPRTLSYFSRAGEGRRRPLALLLVLDLGLSRNTGEYLRRAEVLESVSRALKNLSPEDEVAVVASLGGRGAPLKTLTDFTRDRTKMMETLATVRDLPAPQPKYYSEELENVTQMAERAARERPNSQIIVLPTTILFAPAAVSQ